jgi:hypothetical protein
VEGTTICIMTMAQSIKEREDKTEREARRATDAVNGNNADPTKGLQNVAGKHTPRQL